jgi:hypothetical protein
MNGNITATFYVPENGKKVTGEDGSKTHHCHSKEIY